MISLEEAQQKILAAIKPLPTEKVSLLEAYGRILAQSLSAPICLPQFDNSAMDGFAVRAEDVLGVARNTPVALRLAGRVEAGKFASKPVQAGECARIFTGSALPPGADAVVMQEDVRIDAGDPNRVLVFKSVERGENVRRQGEDAQSGQKLFIAGDALNVGTIGLLAAFGLKDVAVGSRPKVALLAIGNELRVAGATLEPGAIYECNSNMLAPMVVKAGGKPLIYPILPDTLDEIRETLAKAFAEADAVVTTGGVSVGELDFVKPAFEQIGGKLEFWKVAMKPGKPFVFGQLGQKFLFGLPGNPVSALVTFLLLVRPALRRWQGAAETDLPKLNGVLAEKLHNPGDCRHFVRVCIDATGKVWSAGAQASHILNSLAQSNGLLDLPPGATLQASSPVTVLRWDLLNFTTIR